MVDPVFSDRLSALQHQTDVSIRELLDNDQMKIFNQRLVDRRQREANLTRKMEEEGASHWEIAIALFSLE